MASTLVTLVSGSEDTEFIYTHTFDGNSFEFSTVEVKNILGDVQITSPEILAWINGYIGECLDEIYK